MFRRPELLSKVVLTLNFLALVNDDYLRTDLASNNALVRFLINKRRYLRTSPANPQHRHITVQNIEFCPASFFIKTTVYSEILPKVID